jgi:uncharacterized protein (TIGR02246 family)
MPVRNVCLGALVASSLLIFTGCQRASKPEVKQDTASDAAAIHAVINQFVAAYNAGDAAAVGATFADDAIIMPENGAAVEGKPAIQAWYAGLFKNITVNTSYTPLETQVAGDWGYDRGAGMVTATPKGGKPITESFKNLIICKRQTDGAWKIHCIILNNNNPPAATAAKKK